VPPNGVEVREAHRDLSTPTQNRITHRCFLRNRVLPSMNTKNVVKALDWF
jgi:hypothetical protein